MGAEFTDIPPSHPIRRPLSFQKAEYIDIPPSHPIRRPLSFQKAEYTDIPPTQPIRKPLSYQKVEYTDIPPSQPIRKPLSYHVAEYTNIPPSQIMRKALPNSTKDKEIQTTKQVNCAAPLPYQNVLPMEIQAPRSILMKPTTERSLDDVVMTDAYSNNLEYNSPPSIAYINKPQIKYQPMDTSVPPNNFPQIDMDKTVPPLTYSANPQIEYKK